MTYPTFADLTSSDTVDAVIVGGGVAGLTMAYELSQAGLKPVVLEERSRPGGLVAAAPIGNVVIDIGAESYATRTMDVENLCRDLGLTVIDPSGSSWVYHQSADGSTAVPIPHGMLGVPADIDNPIMRDVLTDDEYARARRDLELPADVGADAQTLGQLVSARMGDAVVNRLVRPVAGGIYSADPNALALSNVAPGVLDAMEKTGSLTAAVASLRGRTPSKPAVRQTHGGMFRLIDALADHIRAAGGGVYGRTTVTNIAHAQQPGTWQVTAYATAPGATPADPPTPTGDPTVITTPRLIIATNGQPALDLITPLGYDCTDDWTLPVGGPIAHVTFAIVDKRLNDGPRGSGMLVSAPPAVDPLPDDCVVAKAITHYSYKWNWTREADEPDTHIFRVSYGRAGQPDPKPTIEQGVREAGILLGVDLSMDDVIDAKIIHWDGSLPPFTPQHRKRVAQLETEAHADGLFVVGSWVAGSGLAAVIRHARALSHTVADHG